MPTVYFHFGHLKTGTTSIQNTLLLNRDLLMNKGYYYPKTTMEYYKRQTYRKNNGRNFLLSKKITDGNQTSAWSYHLHFAKAIVEGDNDIINSFINECQEKALKKNLNIILSAEALSLFPEQVVPDLIEQSEESYNISKIAYLKKLFSFFPQFDKKIIIYLRRQDLFVESFYHEHSKIGKFSCSPIEQFWPKLHSLNYFNLLTLIGDIIGHHNIIVRVFEKEQWISNDLLIDFFDALDLKDLDYRIPQLNALTMNHAIAPEFDEYRKLLVPYGIRDKNWSTLLFSIRNMSYHKYGTSKPPTSILLSPEERKKIILKFQEGNANIAKKYLNRNDGILFYQHLNLPEQTHYKLNCDDLAKITGGLFLESQYLAEQQQIKIREHLKCEIENIKSDINGRVNELFENLNLDLKQTQDNNMMLQETIKKLKQDNKMLKRRVGQLEMSFLSKIKQYLGFKRTVKVIPSKSDSLLTPTKGN